MNFQCRLHLLGSPSFDLGDVSIDDWLQGLSHCRTQVELLHSLCDYLVFLLLLCRQSFLQCPLVVEEGDDKVHQGDTINFGCDFVDCGVVGYGLSFSAHRVWLLPLFLRSPESLGRIQEFR